MKNVLLIAMLSLAVGAFGCKKSEEKPASKEAPKPAAANPPVAVKPPASAAVEPSHAVADKSAPSAVPSSHGGEVIDLGTTKIGAFEVRASRDKVEFKAGGDAPIDVWIDGGVGKGVAAVRFWIGTQDAKGSTKAKADIEDGTWHTHVEVPAPVPSVCLLWVEVEDQVGAKQTGSFDLKR